MPMLFLASSPSMFSDALPWFLLLLGLVVVGFIVIYFARRLVYGENDETVDDFTLHGLRELHKTGQLSDEEFEKARAAMIERVQRAAARDEEDSAEAAGESSSEPEAKKTPEVPESGNGSSEKTE